MLRRVTVRVSKDGGQALGHPTLASHGAVQGSLAGTEMVTSNSEALKTQWDALTSVEDTLGRAGECSRHLTLWLFCTDGLGSVFFCPSGPPWPVLCFQLCEHVDCGRYHPDSCGCSAQSTSTAQAAFGADAEAHSRALVDLRRRLLKKHDELRRRRTTKAEREASAGWWRVELVGYPKYSKL